MPAVYMHTLVTDDIHDQRRQASLNAVPFRLGIVPECYFNWFGYTTQGVSWIYICMRIVFQVRTKGPN